MLFILQKLCNWNGCHGNADGILKTLLSRLLDSCVTDRMRKGKITIVLVNVDVSPINIGVNKQCFIYSIKYGCYFNLPRKFYFGKYTVRTSCTCDWINTHLVHLFYLCHKTRVQMLYFLNIVSDIWLYRLTTPNRFYFQLWYAESHSLILCCAQEP